MEADDLIFEPQNPIQEIDFAFFADGKRIAAEAFESGINKRNLLIMSIRLYQALDQFLDAFEAQGQVIDCKKGCAWCCSNAVMVLPHEMFLLKEYLLQKTDPKSLAPVLEKMRQKDEKTSAMRSQDFLHHKTPCALLDSEGACSVYEVRPMACRIYLSKNVNSCLYEFNHSKDMSAWAQLYDIPLRAGRMLNEGACAWMIEHGLTSYEWLFESVFMKIWNNPKGFEEWQGNKSLFKPREMDEEEWRYFDQFGNFSEK